MTGIHDLVPGEHVAPHPRVVFAAFLSGESPMLQAWGRFREPLMTAIRAERKEPQLQARQVPRQAGPSEAATSGLWRLLATNNRELGRSFLLYASFSHARAHVERLQEPDVELEVAIVEGPIGTSRGWLVLHEGSPVMTCGRWYTSTSAVAASVAGAMVALPRAILSEEADHAGPSGRFNRRVSSRNHALQW